MGDDIFLVCLAVFRDVKLGLSCLTTGDALEAAGQEMLPLFHVLTGHWPLAKQKKLQIFLKLSFSFQFLLPRGSYAAFFFFLTVFLMQINKINICNLYPAGEH